MTHIYYIEDDPDIAAAVAEYLEQKGFRVTRCATLARARVAQRVTRKPFCSRYSATAAAMSGSSSI